MSKSRDALRYDGLLLYNPQELHKSGTHRNGETDMSSETWRASPVLGVRNVRQAAEYYRDVLGFSLDPVEGVFQPSEDEPGGVYAIVKRAGVWIHFQIRR